MNKHLRSDAMSNAPVDVHSKHAQNESDRYSFHVTCITGNFWRIWGQADKLHLLSIHKFEIVQFTQSGVHIVCADFSPLLRTFVS